jgi:PAS domain S-box-containing protein
MQELAVLRHRMDGLEALAAMYQQAEDALHESEVRLRTLVQESLQGILVHRNHQPLFVNRAFATMFGYATPEEVLRLGTVLSLIAPPDRARMIAYRDACLRGDIAPSQYEFQGLRQNGTPIWVEASSTVIQWDGAPAILSMNIDITARKQVEEALARYHLLAEQTRDIILFLRRDGQIVDANQAAIAAYGYDRSTLLTMTLSDLHIPAMVPQAAAQLAQAERSGIRFETVHRCKDGSPFPVEVSAVGANIGGERLLLHIVRDINEGRQAKEALRENEARFHTMADAVPALIWLADISKRCTYFNKGWLEFTGRTIEQELGYGWAEGVHPNDRSACLATYTTAFEARQPFELECRLRRADGEYRWIVDRGAPLFAPNGSFIGYIGSGIDITVHKQAEQCVQQVHAEIERRVQERTAALRHEMAERQRAVVESHRLECDTLRAQHFVLLGRLAASVSQEIRNPLGAIMLYADLLEEELQQPTPASPAQIAQWLTEIKTNLTCLDELMQDCLLLVPMSTSQQDVQDLGAAARHCALLGRLAASVSQEIRSPLGALARYADLLEEELQQPAPESPAQIAQWLAEIKTNLTCLDELMQDYLSLVRVSTSQQDVQDLGVAVQAWVADLHGLAAARGVTVRLEGIESLGLVAFHANTLRRAVLNLVQNACDSMPTRGTLTLVGQGTATQVQLQVRDTGSGIPPETLPQIFEPLSTTKPGGTGLRLYIVQEIVTAHAGQVTVQSVVGQGTTFTITLPRATAKELARSANPAGLTG